MGYLLDAERSGFFQELTPEERAEYLSLKARKSVHMIDNIYYTVFVKGDSKEDIPPGLQDLLDDLEENKAEAIKIREPIEYEHGLYYLLKSYKLYSYCVGNPDLYDIFCCKTLPNDDTPRIMVQIRAFGLWTQGKDTMLSESFDKVQALLAQHACTVDWCRESRIDYCFHTNSISNFSRLVDGNKGKVKNLHSNLKRRTRTDDVINEEDGVRHIVDYVCYGTIKANNVRARMYDKVKEVIEESGKSFFFKIWHDEGLISYYDKWCMEYAFQERNMDYLFKAALAFYVAHGTDPLRKECYRNALKSSKATLAQFKELAAQHMPKVTTILNIEYETKRKFYYYSDHFINGFKLTEERGNISKPMERLYKIMDYRAIFLDYLTSKTLAFYKGTDENGEPKYLAWWKRLRNTKHDGKKVDIKLIREYSYQMDKKAVQKQWINKTAAYAVYEDKLESGFVPDLSDMLADLTDNQARKMLLVAEDGEVIERVNGELFKDYAVTKAKKEKALKNRKKRRNKQKEE